MQIITWENRASGIVAISTDGVTYQIPTIGAHDVAAFRGQVVGQWRELAAAAAAKYGISAVWVLAVIWQESRGNRNAHSADGGLGLMQLTSSGVKHGHTTDEIMAPELNIDLGARELARVQKSGWAQMIDGVPVSPTFDLPAVASMYNAGETASGFPHLNEGTNPKFQSRWGLRCSVGYIDSVVAANNTQLLDLGAAA